MILFMLASMTAFCLEKDILIIKVVQCVMSHDTK